MKFLRFNFIDTNKNGTNIEFLVGINSELWENTTITKNLIEDAIASYIDEVEDWQYEELITDVLKTFDLDFEFIEPITFYIYKKLNKGI